MFVSLKVRKAIKGETFNIHFNVDNIVAIAEYKKHDTIKSVFTTVNGELYYSCLTKIKLVNSLKKIKE